MGLSVKSLDWDLEIEWLYGKGISVFWHFWQGVGNIQLNMVL